MKKLTALLLVVLMALSMAACGASGSNETTGPKVVVPASAEEILTNIWNLYGDDEKFAIIGGNMIREALSKDEEEIDDSFAFRTMLTLAIATSIDAAMMAHFLAMGNKGYEAYTGILKEEAEETISCVGYIGKIGMRETDREIVRMMLTQEEKTNADSTQ